MIRRELIINWGIIAWSRGWSAHALLFPMYLVPFSARRCFHFYYGSTHQSNPILIYGLILFYVQDHAVINKA